MGAGEDGGERGAPGAAPEELARETLERVFRRERAKHDDHAIRDPLSQRLTTLLVLGGRELGARIQQGRDEQEREEETCHGRTSGSDRVRK